MCVLILVALAAAQSTTTNGDSSSQQQPGQPPENPMQEPAKPTEEEQNKPQASTFNVGEGAQTGQDQILGEIRLMTRYTELNGDPTRSFRVPGSNNLAEFNFFSDQRFFATRRIQVMSMYRGTDDFSIDPERNSIQKGYVRIFGPRDEYIFGDSLVNFSRLSFNQNIKGANITQKLGDHWKITGIGGIFIDRWGSLYKDLPSRPFTALVTGARLEFNPMKDSSIGLNFSNFDDNVGSLPAFLPDGTPQPGVPALNRVLSLDQKWVFKNGLRVDGEFAYSFTDFDQRSSTGCDWLDENGNILDFETRRQRYCESRVLDPNLDLQADWGARLEASWRLNRVSLRASYLRFQPAFASLNARQIDDLQDFVTRASFDLTDWLTFDGTLRRSNDNLKQQDAYTTVVWGPEARFILHDLPIYPRATLEGGYRYRDLASSNLISVNRLVRIPYVELTLPVQTTFFSIGYELRQVRDYVNMGQTSNTDRYFVGVRGMWDLGAWRINPSLRWEMERMGHRPNQGATVIDRELIYDTNRLGSASLLIETPKWFILEGQFRSSSSTLTSRTLDTLTNLYTSSPTGYSRPSYRAALTYKINNDENTLFIFSFERNNNFYFSSNDYDERMWAGTLVYRFGRRAQ